YATAAPCSSDVPVTTGWWARSSRIVGTRCCSSRTTSAGGSPSVRRCSRRSWASVACGLDGELERKGRSLPRQGLHLERSAVRFGDRARDEQAESRSRLRRAAGRTAELLEDEALLLPWDALAAIVHFDDDPPVQRRRRDFHCVAGRRILHRVVDQVPHDLPQARAIAADSGQRTLDR